MPSTLYESVKGSVIEFANLRKKNQKLEDKLIFRWKLITLGLSIVFIILVGAFSQILKSINSLPTLINDKSFILNLVDKVSDQSVPTVKQANNLIVGISGVLGGNVDTYNFNDATLLYNYPTDTLDIATIVSKINSRGPLVFVVSSNEPTPLSKFAFFGYGGYSESAGIANVYDRIFLMIQNKDTRLFSTSTPPKYINTPTHPALSIEETPQVLSYSSPLPSKAMGLSKLASSLTIITALQGWI